MDQTESTYHQAEDPRKMGKKTCNTYISFVDYQVLADDASHLSDWLRIAFFSDFSDKSCDEFFLKQTKTGKKYG